METEWQRSRATESLGTGPEVSGHCQQPDMTPVKEVLQALCSDREHMGPEQMSLQGEQIQSSALQQNLTSPSNLSLHLPT